jgi:hypothetical protein
MEYFSSNPPTNYIVSNNAQDASDDKYLDIDEEFKIGTQRKNSSERKWQYKFIRAPINASVVVRAKIPINGKMEPAKSAIIRLAPNEKTKNLYFDVENLFFTNGALVSDINVDVVYYVKFLSEKELQSEMRVKQAQDLKTNLYNRCLLDQKGLGMSNNKIIALCQNMK